VTHLRSLDLFSCLGSHAIGLGRSGIETVAFCESNPWRRAQLSKRFPEKPVYDDVRTFKGVPADIIIGGPPCQQTSVAAAITGKRTGDTLWPEMLRIGINVAAKWFIVEQPPGNAPWEAQVGNDLSRVGFHVARFEFGACDIGAPYLRRRVFLVACTSLPRLEIAWAAIPSAIDSVKRAAHARGDWDPDKLRALRVDAGPSGGRERREQIEALGDSNPPHMAETIGMAIIHAESSIVTKTGRKG